MSHHHDNHVAHSHQFSSIRKENERRTLIVVILTLVTMIAEIVAGVFTGSMALLSDGWHMGTHAGALGIALFAYAYTRKHANDSRYTFGTGKVGVLAAFTSAIILGVTGVLIFYESIERLVSPVEINFSNAILVAAIGLVVNFFCAWILGSGNHHHHHHGEDGEEGRLHHHETDQNYRAAFLHVVADALTSVLAIGALSLGMLYNLVWLDSFAGLLGGTLILSWAYGLVRRTSRILLDGDVETKIIDEIRTVIEADADNDVLDLHIWRIGENDLAAIVSLVTDSPKSPEHYRALLKKYEDLKHISIEVHKTNDEND